jgi:hypothetical protein
MSDYEWYPKEKSDDGCGAWVESNGYKLRYKIDDTDDVTDILVSDESLSDSDAHRNHIHFYWSSSSLEWKCSAKFRDYTTNELH